MFVIAGVRPQRTVLATVTLICGACRHPAAHRLTEEINKFTVFFIPTVTVKTTFQLECVFCGASSPMKQAEARALEQRAKQPGVSPGTVLGAVQPGRRKAG